MPTPQELLAQSLAKLQTANRIDGTKNSYRKDMPGEYGKVVTTYLNGGARPTGVTSDMGMGLMLAEDARRALAGTQPPEPEPEPPTGEWVQVAVEHGSFTLSDQAEVRYGKNTAWVVKTLFAGTHVCNSGTFGSDPAPGVPKECQVGGVAPVPEPPEPSEPPPSNAKPLVGSITSGGTYTGAFTGAVAVNTQQPVIIDGAVGNIRITTAGGVDLTVRRCKISGPDAWDSPRWLTCENWKRLVVENNTIVNTRGIELWPNGQSNPTTVISKNRHTNPKGNGTSPVGNFVQLRAIWGSPKWGPTPNPNPGVIEISWNEIIGVHNHNNAEDVFSIYKTARVRCHDNLINGQSKPDQFSGSSQNSITIDPADEPSLLYDNLIERNFVIDAYAIGMFGGNNNRISDNYVVSDGKMGDTGQAMRYGYEGLWVAPGFTGNVATGNKVGYIGSQGRNDGRLNNAGDWTNNTHLPDPITRQTELDDIEMWRQRVRAAGITVGA